jgi:nitroreductase
MANARKRKLRAMDIFEVMETCRAMRRLKPDPIPRETLEKLIYYATRAPSAGNAQLWRFLVVTEPEEKRFFGDLLRERMGSRLQPIEGDSRAARTGRAFQHLIRTFDQVPAIVFTCIENGYPPSSPNPQFMWSSVYPATQNLLLAARALGLGTCMTTFHMGAEAEIKAHYGIPENVSIGATIPVGYPEGNFGPVGRVPIEQVTHWERWG